MARKRCPFCAEDVHQDAIKCKHCSSDLPATAPAVAPAEPAPAVASVESAPAAVTSRTRRPMTAIVGGLVGLLLVVGAVLGGFWFMRRPAQVAVGQPTTLANTLTVKVTEVKSAKELEREEILTVSYTPRGTFLIVFLDLKNVGKTGIETETQLRATVVNAAGATFQPLDLSGAVPDWPGAGSIGDDWPTLQPGFGQPLPLVFDLPDISQLPTLKLELVQHSGKIGNTKTKVLGSAIVDLTGVKVAELMQKPHLDEKIQDAVMQRIQSNYDTYGENLRVERVPDGDIEVDGKPYFYFVCDITWDESQISNGLLADAAGNLFFNSNAGVVGRAPKLTPLLADESTVPHLGGDVKADDYELDPLP